MESGQSFRHLLLTNMKQESYLFSLKFIESKVPFSAFKGDTKLLLKVIFLSASKIGKNIEIQ